MQRGHVPVLLEETLAVLAPVAGETFVDATAGLGGHAIEVGRRVGARGRVVLNDLDAGNLARAAANLEALSAGERPEIVCLQGNFATLPARLGARGIAADCLLADLGFASTQVDDAGRGFSFRLDGPLDMRFDPSKGLTAAALVGSLSEGELTRILAEFGEERAAGRIARKLVRARAAEPITRTEQLADLVRSVVGAGPTGMDAATRTFQALRIAVNDELGSLDALLAGIRETSVLAPGARVAVISFHSLEDRLVKVAMGEMVESGAAAQLTDGALIAGQAERDANPRSRSAKLRGIRLLRASG